MRIYLDNCALQRPLDNSTAPRIAAEAEAVLEILERCADGELQLLHSQMILEEIDETPDVDKRARCHDLLRVAVEFVTVTPVMHARAAVLVSSGLKLKDATHLAMAESAAVDYLCTCDDRFLKRGRKVAEAGVIMISPAGLLEELEQ